MLYIIFLFFATRDICCRHIIFGFIQTPSTQSFIFFVFISRPSILTVEARFLCKSLFFLIKYISVYLLGVNCVLYLLTHTMYQLCAAISFLQLSAALPPQVTKLVSLMNLKLSVLFLIYLKCSSSFKIKKRKRIGDNSNSCGISINM